MKRGFTLIELLAVIVILAIIALIATPIVLSIIEDTKESAILRSAEYYLTAVEHSIMKKNMNAGRSFSPNTCVVQTDGDLLCDGTDTLEIEVNGEVPSSGTIKFEKGKLTFVELIISNKEICLNSSIEKLEYKLSPGLYDKNNKLIASWEKLVEEYDLESLIENGGSTLNDIEEEVGRAGQVIDSIKGASKLVIDKNVTSIGDYAFSGCSSLTSVIIPNSVTSIGDYAFSGCSSLTSVIIPNSVTSIGGAAFYSCSSLKSITISNSITSIGYWAFAGCIGLTNIVVDENNPVYDSRDNSNAIIETSTNTLITGCKNTVIPNSVTSIGAWAFFECTSLKSITIPNSVTSIGFGAFYGCSSLKSITISNSVTSIGGSAFVDCTSLTSITIPDSVTSIGGAAFFGCSSLTSIIISNSVTSIGGAAFSHCTGLTSITIPNSVTSIGDYAFSYCTKLTTIYYKGTSTGSPWGAPNATVIKE